MVTRTLLAAVAASVFGACATTPSPTNQPAPPSATVSAEASLQIKGDLPNPSVLTPGELERLGAEDVTWTFRGTSHVYRGVRLDRLLQDRGFDRGPGGADVPPADRRPGWRNVVIARAGDGFFAVFTLAELMPEMGLTRAYIAWIRDGQPIGGDEGPMRLVVLTDQHGSRCVRDIRELQIFDLRRMPH